MEINGLKSINFKTFTDNRGSFTRLYDTNFLDEIFDINQINLSISPQEGTLRGMHYQLSGPREDKYLNIISGLIYVVVVDMRSGESTYLNINQRVLSATEAESLYIPSGCATGWLSLTNDTKLLYSMSARFEECTYGGFRYNDPSFSINWPSNPKFISEKDLSWPNFIVK